MKGPYERLKYELRRVWECPECHRRERTEGTVTTVPCRCGADQQPPQVRWMRLIEDGMRRVG
jgi:CDGSH-type Zn-finger protein